VDEKMKDVGSNGWEDDMIEDMRDLFKKSLQIYGLLPED